VGLDPVWAQAQEAGLPVVFHVGGGHRLADGKLLDMDYFENGGPRVPDFHGGDENFRSVDYMAIPTAPMQTLATMIFDGVLDRFPRLRFGVIEQGAAWVPSWMRTMDSAFHAFRKREERLQKLSLLPSEFVRRQIRATPYPAEDVGWIISQAGTEVCLFSSDYPHVEGGRNPIKRFEESMGALDEGARQRFYFENFIDLMGRGLRSAA
jgi:predicted TIM-barrel fold metal-dependent hydrolase